MKTTAADVKNNIQENQKLAVTVAEMAQMLSVSRPFCYEIINRSDFTGDFKIGTRRLVSVDYLRKWIENQIHEQDI